MTALIVIIILCALIIAHEFGHFIVAKLFHVRVDEFGLGYPPRALSLGKWWGTEYTINWIPFGGFVRIFGEDGAGGAESFGGKSVFARVSILSAGVVANMIVAWFLIATTLLIGGFVPAETASVNTKLMVTNVLEKSPAVALHATAGDLITSIASKKDSLSEFTPDAARAFISLHAGESLHVTFKHNDISMSGDATPAQAVVSGSENRAALGIGLALVEYRSFNPIEAFGIALNDVRTLFVETVQGLIHLLSTAIFGGFTAKDLSGPLGLASVVGDALPHGPTAILRVAAFISINLAVINLVPIPLLDGGRIAIILIEALLRRKIPRVSLHVLHTFSLLLIGALMVYVTWNDIAHLLA